MNLLKRILGFPFVLCLLVISAVFLIFKNSYQYLLHGCEVTMYDRDDKITIQDIYWELKQRHLEKKDDSIT
jgi:hypothetical protein